MVKGAASPQESPLHLCLFHLHPCGRDNVVQHRTVYGVRLRTWLTASSTNRKDKHEIDSEFLNSRNLEIKWPNEQVQINMELNEYPHVK